MNSTDNGVVAVVKPRPSSCKNRLVFVELVMDSEESERMDFHVSCSSMIIPSAKVPMYEHQRAITNLDFHLKTEFATFSGLLTVAGIDMWNLGGASNATLGAVLSSPNFSGFAINVLPAFASAGLRMITQAPTMNTDGEHELTMEQEDTLMDYFFSRKFKPEYNMNEHLKLVPDAAVEQLEEVSELHGDISTVMRRCNPHRPVVSAGVVSINHALSQLCLKAFIAHCHYSIMRRKMALQGYFELLASSISFVLRHQQYAVESYDSLVSVLSCVSCELRRRNLVARHGKELAAAIESDGSQQ